MPNPMKIDAPRTAAATFVVLFATRLQQTRIGDPFFEGVEPVQSSWEMQYDPKV
jgi:hypothetical protein